jgi:hypothetical protein
VSANDLLVVVRSAGERTEALCLDAIRAQTDARTEITRERPFANALRRSVRLGIEASKRWTLCVDADVLLAPGSIARLTEHLAAEPEAFFACAYLMDKYYGLPMARGVHLYRTDALPEAEAAIPTEDAERPETAMKEVLLGRGRKCVYVRGRVLGLHGFGQFYRDIFRTIATRAQKSRDQFPILMDRFTRGAVRDVDLRVALWGLVAGSDGVYSLDAHHWDEAFHDLASASGLVEKQPVAARAARAQRRSARLATALPLGFWRRPTVRRLREW